MGTSYRFRMSLRKTKTVEIPWEREVVMEFPAMMLRRRMRGPSCSSRTRRCCRCRDASSKSLWPNPRPWQDWRWSHDLQHGRNSPANKKYTYTKNRRIASVAKQDFLDHHKTIKYWFIDQLVLGETVDLLLERRTHFLCLTSSIRRGSMTTRILWT